MMTRVFRYFASLCIAMLASVAAAQSLLPTTETDSRIIVFDASGSMAQSDFRRNSTERIQVAHELLVETYARLLENRDDVPTSTLVFGAEYDWSDERRRNGWSDPSDPRTLDHPICRDSVLRLNASPVTRSSVRTAEDLVRSGELSPNGMTPIHVSLLQGLQSFDGDIEGQHLQFVLISDLEQPNCLPKGESLCDQLLPDLGRIQALGGSVSAIVFEAPTAGLIGTLDDCMGLISFPVSPDVPSSGIPPIVEEAFDLLAVEPRFIAGGQNNLDPNGVEPDTARLRFIEAGSRVPLAAGPFGVFDLPPRRYTVAGTIDATTFEKMLDIDRDGAVPIDVAPGVLVILAEDAASGNIPLITSLEISRPNGSPIGTLSNYNAGTPINLANGEYLITGRLTNGQTMTGSVVLELGATRELTLTFGTPAAQTALLRDVRINVALYGPTLDVQGNWPPAITLTGPNGAQIDLTGSGYAGKLEPGTYTVQIQSLQPHRLSFDLSNGDKPYEVNLDVPAGWFTLTSASGRAESYELRTGGGLSLFRLDGSRLQHALPEGTYQIARLNQDGTAETRTFQILLGRETAINDL